MSNEEISFKILELYYSQENYNLNLDEVIRKYKYILDELKELKENNNENK